MRSDVNFFIPAGCLLRTNSSIPGSPDGIIASLVSSFELAACAGAFMRKPLAARHASENARHESEGIVPFPYLFLEPPNSGNGRCGRSLGRYTSRGALSNHGLACPGRGVAWAMRSIARKRCSAEPGRTPQGLRPPCGSGSAAHHAAKGRRAAQHPGNAARVASRDPSRHAEQDRIPNPNGSLSIFDWTAKGGIADDPGNRHQAIRQGTSPPPRPGADKDKTGGTTCQRRQSPPTKASASSAMAR